MTGRIATSILVMAVAVGLASTTARPFPVQAQTAPTTQADSGPRTINITAKRFAFVPAEVTLKKGETVKLVLKSEDVTHGIFVRALKLDQDIPAGQTVEVSITPQTAGTFTAICDHFCGTGHGNMKMTFIVQE